MPALSFPNVTLRMPVARTLTGGVRVITFLDGSEQRFAVRPWLNSFRLVFADVPASDVTAIEGFVDTVKGAFDTTWEFTGPDGVVYPGMALEQDELIAEEAAEGRWSVSVAMRQVAQAGSYADTAAAVYPALANGCYTQFPWQRSRAWMTTKNDLASGARVAWAERDAALRAWRCSYPVLTATELATRVSFFVAMRGPLRAFTMHDAQTGGNVTNCRFGSDALEVRCVGAGQWATDLVVREFVP